MSAFNLEDVSSKVEDWLEILNRYNDNVNDDDIWSSATGLSYQPQFSNIYQELIMMKIVKHFADEVGVEVSDLDFKTYANCQDSSLTIEGNTIFDENDYDNALEEYRDRRDGRYTYENEDDNENWDDEDEDDE